jgi:hypothetical protein
MATAIKSGKSDDVARRTASIRDLARKLSSYDLEELEATLKELDRAVYGLREMLSLPPGDVASGRRRFEAASPSTENPDKLDRGPAVGSDPSAI